MSAIGMAGFPFTLEFPVYSVARFTRHDDRTMRLASALACIGFAAVSGCWVLSEPDYDASHPDYISLAKMMDEARRELEAGGLRASIDLAGLNGGEWQIACFFGGYRTPSRTLAKLGVKLSSSDAERLRNLREGLRAAEVEEFEGMIAYVTSEGMAHLIHFRSGIGPNGQHFKRCIHRPQTVLQIDDKVDND